MKHATNIYLVRHGQATAPWDRADDPGLSELGRQQADDTARQLLERVQPGIRLVSSPLQRARETARPLAEALDAQVAIAAPFREIPTPVERGDRQTWLNGIARQRWSEQEPMVCDWRSTLLARLRQVREPTVVFTHFMVLNAIVSELTDDDRVVCFLPDNASVTTVRWANGDLRLVELGRQFRTPVN
jgi:broad specificity phosphatase PhoE